MALKIWNWTNKPWIAYLVFAIFSIGNVNVIWNDMTTDSYEYRNDYIHILEEIDQQGSIIRDSIPDFDNKISSLRSIKGKNELMIIYKSVLFLGLAIVLSVIINRLQYLDKKGKEQNRILNELCTLNKESETKNIAELFKEIKTNSSKINISNEKCSDQTSNLETSLTNISNKATQVDEKHENILNNFESRFLDIKFHEKRLKTFFSLGKYSNVIFNKFLKFNVNVNKSSIYFNGYSLFNYSKLVEELLSKSSISYFGTLKKETLPDWFFTASPDNDEMNEGAKKSFLLFTNKEIGIIKNKNETEKFKAIRYIICTKDELISSFNNKYFEEKNFNEFIDYHSNIDLYWLEPMEINKLTISDNEKKFLLNKEDFALIDNEILLDYNFKNQASLTSDHDLLNESFSIQLNQLENIAKGKEEITKLFNDTKNLETI